MKCIFQSFATASKLFCEMQRHGVNAVRLYFCRRQRTEAEQMKRHNVIP